MVPNEKVSLSDVFDEISAKNTGQTLEEYRESKAKRDALIPKANQIEGTPPSDWPRLEFNWDLSINGRQYSLDWPVFLPGQDIPNAIAEWKQNLNGLELGWVELEKFDHCLCSYSRRDGLEELWSVGNSSQLAFVVAYLSEGWPISPPVAKPHSEGGIILIGGHHRYAAAKAVRLKTIPIYCWCEHRDEIDVLLKVEWGEKC